MMLDLPYLLNKYSLKPKGVLHIGASEGQEAETYNQLDITTMIFVEAIPSVCKKLKENIAKYPDAFCYNECISDEDNKEIVFHIANNGGQSSSMLEFGNHSLIHPEVKYTDTIRLLTARIDTLFYFIDFTGWFVNIDLQGAELLALKGMGELLNQFSCALIEINKKPVYIGCPMVEEIDDYMSEFKRVETGKWVGDSWTDGFYVKKSLC